MMSPEKSRPAAESPAPIHSTRACELQTPLSLLLPLPVFPPTKPRDRHFDRSCSRTLRAAQRRNPLLYHHRLPANTAPLPLPVLLPWPKNARVPPPSRRLRSGSPPALLVGRDGWDVDRQPAITPPLFALPLPV